ncbi:MAG: T9SS type A sorting domain-containing protein [Flavobacteriales bacterium]|nr:T9SS type A sorting domain-containing protein [Flavobacteriales bacterium]
MCCLLICFVHTSYGQSDFCSTATSYSACTSVAGTTAGATANTGSGQDDSYLASYICAGSMENTVWYTFTAPTTNNYTLNWCANACTSGWGIQTGVLTGPCGGPYTSLGCSYVSNGTCTAYDVALTAGQQVYIVVDGDAGDECSFTLDGCPVALPVLLASMNAECVEGGVLLHWSTLTEINNDYFTIEKSLDAENFVPIGIVNGHGNSKELHQYQYLDRDAGSSTVYYRLKQTDFDGAYEYFNTVSTTCENMGVTIFPNPFKDELTIILPNSDTYKIQITDVLGNIVWCDQLSNASNHKLRLDFLNAQGVYFTSVYTATDDLITVQKILKQ